jgi:LacI family transcriptional regulator
VQQVLRGAGYSLILTGSEDRREGELELLDALSSRRIDGLILTTSSEADVELLRTRQSLQVPIVLLDRATPESFDALLIDHRTGVRVAVDYLLDLGHRRVALITGSGTVRPAAERLLGYRDATEARGLTVDPDLLRTGSFVAEFGYEQTLALLDRRNPPTALIAGGIAMLPGVLRALRKAGLRVPQDISVIGSCDSDLAELGSPPVTVLRWDYSLLGRRAAEMLVDRLEGDRHRPAKRIEVGAELIVRSSCGPPAGRTRASPKQTAPATRGRSFEGTI